MSHMPEYQHPRFFGCLVFYNFMNVLPTNVGIDMAANAGIDMTTNAGPIFLECDVFLNFMKTVNFSVPLKFSNVLFFQNSLKFLEKQCC